MIVFGSSSIKEIYGNIIWLCAALETPAWVTLVVHRDGCWPWRHQHLGDHITTIAALINRCSTCYFWYFLIDQVPKVSFEIAELWKMPWRFRSQHVPTIFEQLFGPYQFVSCGASKVTIHDVSVNGLCCTSPRSRCAVSLSNMLSPQAQGRHALHRAVLGEWCSDDLMLMPHAIDFGIWLYN